MLTCNLLCAAGVERRDRTEQNRNEKRQNRTEQRRTEKRRKERKRKDFHSVPFTKITAEVTPGIIK